MRINSETIVAKQKIVDKMREDITHMINSSYESKANVEISRFLKLKANVAELEKLMLMPTDYLGNPIQINTSDAPKTTMPFSTSKAYGNEYRTDDVINK